MDLVLLGGTVLTMDARNTRAEAVAVDNGHIAAIGATAEIAPCVGPETTVVPLVGRTLLPGFLDPHNHFSLTTFAPVSVDCSMPPQRHLTPILDAIATAAKAAPRGRWLRGWGFRPREVRDNRAMTRWALDEVAPENPVCIMDGSCHACYVNSAALALAGIDRHTPDPPHGRILREPNGEPNGTLWERAIDLVHALSLRAYLDYYGDTVAELVQANGMRHLACGITSIGDALVTPEAAAMYRLAEARHRLPFVLHQMLGGVHFFAPPEEAATGTIDDGHVSDRLRGGTVKLLMDPVFPRSAQLCFHASGEVEHLGEPYYTQEEVNRLVLRAHQRGLQVAIHCLGTWAIEQALTAFEHALRASPRAEPRFRIEHFTYPTGAQIRRAQSLGVVACVQPPFVFTGGHRREQTARELGGDVRSLPLRTMLDAGMVVAATSDSPGAPVEPLLGLYAMVTRQTQGGGPPAGPDEAVTPLDGLRMYTRTAAYAMGREREVGSLEPGKRADLVVLSHDPTAVDPAFLRDILVEQTYVEGRCLYQR
jgi:predicted amidohydrolase YtcJ